MMMHSRIGDMQINNIREQICKPSNRDIARKCGEHDTAMFLNHVTGNPRCTIQVQTGIPSYLARVPSLPQNVHIPCHSQPYKTGHIIGEMSPARMIQSPCSDSMESKSMITAPGIYPLYNVEHQAALAEAYHPYSAFYSGFDLNSARRKNATRETTSALKAWLYEHRKNPYPTKGEKIMLAIITRMTLTQVSTWFANARRRLKKENKLDDKDADFSDIDIEDCTDDSPIQGNQSACSSPSIAETRSECSDSLLGDKLIPGCQDVDGNANLCVCGLTGHLPVTDHTLCLHVDGPKTKIQKNRLNAINSDKMDISSGSSESKNTVNVNDVKDITDAEKRLNAGVNDIAKAKQKIWSVSDIIR